MSTTVQSSTPSPAASTIMTTVTTTMASTPSPGPPGGGGGGGEGGAGQQNNSASIATSASLYLYTFLATLVLLLSVSAAIVIRSFILRRRHRLMVEEAIRNGTWVPPAPPSRRRAWTSARSRAVGAYIDEKGSVAALYASDGSAEGKHDHWRAEQTRDWDTIKPFSAAYVSRRRSSLLQSPRVAPRRCPWMRPLHRPGLGATPSATSVHRSGLPAKTSRLTPLQQGCDCCGPSAVTAARPRHPPAPRHRTFFSRALRMLDPARTRRPRSPTPRVQQRGRPLARRRTSRWPSYINRADRPEHDARGRPHRDARAARVRVALRVQLLFVTFVLFRMRRLPRPAVTALSADDDEHPLPHLEVGVAEVLMVPPEMTAPYSRGKVRDSVGSQGSRESDGSPV
ncbi:hypothetical protein BJ912DRAFT_626834 [Pholiota molesta]|nr:hypothetical protein BJ912DRAFT_626834 [Pholiota molesta]